SKDRNNENFIFEINSYNDDNFDYVREHQPPPPFSSSLAFVFDVTGSMYDDLQQVIFGASHIYNTTIRRENSIYDYILIPFHDPEIGPILRTRDSARFQRGLQDLIVQGGGDCPEMVISAVKTALEYALPNSFIYVFTDARSKDYHLIDSVLKLIQEKQSQIVFVMTGDCGNQSHQGYQVFHKVAATSSGQVFTLKKQQVSEILNFVQHTIQARKVNILALDKQSRDKFIYTIPVDSQLLEFTISVSGSNPQVVLTDPTNTIINQRTWLTRLLRLKEVYILNVKHPLAGEWKIQVTSSSAHSIRITGLSSLTFSHGFSREPVSDLSLTTRQPLKGLQTHLTVQPTKLEKPGFLERAEFIDLFGKVITSVPLLPIEQETKNLYNTSKLVLSDGFFYVRIYGYDKKGYKFQRTSQTAIVAFSPDIPKVQMEKHVEFLYNQSGQLLCNVESIIPYSIQWFRNGTQFSSATEYLQSSSISLPIGHPTSADKGVYVCNASSSAGSNIAETRVNVLDPPPFVYLPNNLPAILGSTIFVDCNVSSITPYNSTWIIENSLIDEQRVTKHNNGTLELRQIQKSDDGTYVCEATNEGGKTRAAVSLNVQESPNIYVYPHIQTYAQNWIINLTCAGTGYPPPKLQWKRDGYPLQLSSRIQVVDGLLTILRATQHDEGYYECVGTNTLGQAVQTAQLLYAEVPTIYAEKAYLLVKVGDRATLKCIVNGSPPPEVRWYKGDKEITSGNHYRRVAEGNLFISNVASSDTDNYNCVAQNDAGSTLATIRLEVGDIPKISASSTRINAEYNHNVTMMCNVTGYPVPKISWIYDNNSVQNTHRIYQTDNTLIIFNVQPRDAGQYVCRADNVFGINETSFQLSITGILPPRIAENRSMYEVLLNDEIYLTCQVHGHPQPTITWFHNGYQLFQSSNHHITGSGSLHIRRVSLANDGIYTCIAENSAGNATHTVQVDVLTPPTLIDDSRKENATVELQITTGSTALLPCPVRKNVKPKPAIDWYKDGVELLYDDQRLTHNIDGSLEIEDVQNEDAAIYMCRVTNLLGNATHIIHLVLLVDPIILDAADSSLQVNMGEEARLLCNARGYPTPIIEPIINGRKYILNNDGTLLISNVQEHDVGIYTCYAINSVGNASRNIEMIVTMPPRINLASQTNLHSIVSQTLTILCDHVGIPRPLVTWYKNGKPLFISNERIQTLPSGALVIHSVLSTDKGFYMCYLTNAYGEARQEFEVDIWEPPALSGNPPLEIEANAYQTVLLPCTITGHPVPVINWFRNTAPISYYRNMNTHVHADGTLEIKKVDPTDNDQYTCKASNAAGNTTHTVMLNINIPPVIMTDESGTAIKTTVGQDLILSCPTNGLPRPVLTWHKEDIQIWQDHRTFFNDDHTQLTVRNVQTTDHGTFRCTATNKAGKSEKIFVVTVNMPPSTSGDRLQKKSVILNHSLFLNCPAVGVPTPEIVWYKAGEQLSPSEVLVITNEGKTLKITNIELKDEGRFVCQATNAVGSTDMAFDIEVFSMLLFTEYIIDDILCIKNILAPPEFAESSVEKTFINGEHMRLSCTVHGKPIPSHTWYYNAIKIVPYNNIRFIHDGLYLEIENIQPVESGQYICVAENIAGQAKLHYNVKVMVPTKFNETMSSDTRLEAILHQEVLMLCSAYGIPPPNITWMRDGNLINSSNDRFLIRENGHQLVIPMTLENDTGRYECTAVNEVGQASKIFELDILVPPKIHSNQLITRIQIIQNSTLTLKCPASGHPTPSINWYKDESKISNYQHRDNSETLIMYNIDERDGGRYTCVATNSVGKQRQHFEVIISIPPKIITDRIDQTPSVIRGSMIILDCTVTGRPLPSVTWTRGGNNITLSNKFTIQNRQLIIRDVQLDDSGKWECKATNQIGQDILTYNLQVLVPPEIFNQDGEELLQIPANNTVQLICETFAIPPAQIEWKKNGYPIMINDKATFVHGTNHILNIKIENEHDGGTYSCVAQNIAGRNEKQFLIDVFTPPSIEQQQIDTINKVLITKSHTFICIANGIPRPRIQWFKNGKLLKTKKAIQILQDGQLLDIHNITQNDSGAYTCTAKNIAGEAVRNFELKVLVPPSIDNDDTDGFNETNITVNKTLTINCFATGKPEPEIMWLKDGQHLNRSSVQYHIRRYGRQLDVSISKASDGGVYTCLAKNEAGVDERNFKVGIMIPPTIESVITQTQVVVGNHVLLDCRANGVPEPDVKWFYRKKSVVDNSHFLLTANNRHLQILQTKLNHTGVYTCQATNEAGSTIREFYVDVLMPPSIIDSEFQSEVVVFKDETIVLNCTVTAIPTPKITFLKDGQTIIANSRLIIQNAAVTDRGRYRCVAENIAGTSYLDYDLQVFVSPEIVPKILELNPNVIIDRQIILDCPIFSIPESDYYWFKDNNISLMEPQSADRQHVRFRSGSMDYSEHFSLDRRTPSFLSSEMIVFDVE
ncbi:unnamed protein product, partial [Didymodactylos carnosus]